MGYILTAAVLLVIFGLLFLWLVFTGKYKRAQASGYKNIRPNEAKARLNSEKDMVLVDVRSPQEYITKFIPGSILIPLDVLEQEAPYKLRDKDRTILVYCQNGSRSIRASKKLARLGYTQVYNLGGINHWPYETKSKH